MANTPFLQFGRGLPDAPETVVSVFVVPPPPPPQPSAPLPAEDLEPEVAPDAVPTVEPADEPEEEAPPDSAAPAVAAAEAPPPTAKPAPSAPNLTLPTVDAGRGRRDGLVALSCNDQFSDPDKAAECAGREIRSGWQGNVDEIGEDWSKIAEDMRRGGYAAPSYGPDPLAGMGEGTRVFEGEDVRFRNREFDRWGRYTKSFNSPKEYRDYQRLRDFRRYVGEGGAISSGYGISETVPLSGWQPSWQLRDDPNIDRRELDALVREANE
ncbi:MAG: hypothetical protein ACWA5T_05680 [Parvularcula sp.]